jgi:hypothetical protein
MDHMGNSGRLGVDTSELFSLHIHCNSGGHRQSKKGWDQCCMKLYVNHLYISISTSSCLPAHGVPDLGALCSQLTLEHKQTSQQKMGCCSPDKVTRRILSHTRRIVNSIVRQLRDL